MQGDGNLVLYQGSKALWASGTAGDDGATVTMQGDGNLVVYKSGMAKWSSNTAGFQGASLTLQNDGNLVVYQGSHPVWDWSAGYLGDKLTAGVTLTPGEELYSADHDFRLIMQGDGNLVLYQGSKALWSSGTAGDSGASVTMQGDGNLVVYKNGAAKWHSNTAGFSGDFLQLQDDSNLVLYQGSHPLWDWSAGYVGDRMTAGVMLTPGEELYSANHDFRLIMQGDGNLVLYEGGKALWASGTDGDNGATVTMQGDGNLVVYDQGKAKWSSGTAGSSGAFLELQDDNNLVIYQGSAAIWDWRSGKLSGGGGSQAQAIVNAAQAMESQGYPYCFDGGNTQGPTVGTTDPDSDGSYSNCASIGKVGFDCTGLTLYAVYQGTGNAGLSHDGYQAKSGGGQVIGSQSSLQPGDVVYFDYNASNGLSYIDHAGIYVGGGNVLSAVSEKYGIRTESISWYEAGGLHFVGGARFWH